MEQQDARKKRKDELMEMEHFFLQSNQEVEQMVNMQQGEEEAKETPRTGDVRVHPRIVRPRPILETSRNNPEAV